MYIQYQNDQIFFTLQCELFTSYNVSNNASLVTARTGGGEWSTKCGQTCTERGGVPKIPKTVRTSFMDDPKGDYQKPLKKFIFLLNPVPFNWQSYTKQKRLATSDQSFFSLRNKYTKISLLVMQFIVYYQTKFDGVI